MKLDAKQAAIAARDYYMSMSDFNPEDITLEEVELSEDEKFWFITLGNIEYRKGLLPGYERRYKIFKVNSDTGQVMSMKIRIVSVE